jgi:hypothetical protein
MGLEDRKTERSRQHQDRKGEGMPKNVVTKRSIKLKGIRVGGQEASKSHLKNMAAPWQAAALPHWQQKQSGSKRQLCVCLCPFVCQLACVPYLHKSVPLCLSALGAA